MIIGLTGFQGSGKSTAAEYISNSYGFTRLNFKDGLIAEMLDKFPDTLRMLDDYINDQRGLDKLFEIKHPITRALMQNYGTEVRRAENPDYWANIYTEALEYYGNVVTDDVRFLNEEKTIRDNGGVIVRIIREDIKPWGQHKSETEQNQIKADFTVVAEKSDLHTLHTGLDKAIAELKTNVD